MGMSWPTLSAGDMMFHQLSIWHLLDFLVGNHDVLMEEIRLTSWYENPPLFPGFYISQVVREFFHQPYVWRMKQWWVLSPRSIGTTKASNVFNHCVSASCFPWLSLCSPVFCFKPFCIPLSIGRFTKFAVIIRWLCDRYTVCIHICYIYIHIQSAHTYASVSSFCSCAIVHISHSSQPGRHPWWRRRSSAKYLELTWLTLLGTHNHGSEKWFPAIAVTFQIQPFSTPPWVWEKEQPTIWRNDCILDPLVSGETPWVPSVHFVRLVV